MRRRTELPDQIVHSLDVVAENRFASYLQSITRALGRDQRIAIPVAANPRTKPQHSRQRVRRYLFTIGFTKIVGQLVIQRRQGLKQNTRIVIEPHSYFVANCRLTASYFIGLPERGYLRNDCLLVFF